jgi:predicted component of type VI protein secretion system
VTLRIDSPDFSSLFDRAAAACAESQRVVNHSAQTAERARVSRAASSLLRRTAVQMREAWANADAMHSVLRTEVEEIARAMRDAGVDDHAAVATVRARIRFVLYDGGLTEQDTEPVVERASLWVEQVYAAA